MAPTSEDSVSLNLPKQLFINNKYRSSTHSATLQVKNPADESLIADDVPIAGPSDVDCAVEAAQKAFPGWKAMDSSKRRDILISFAQLLTKYNSELCLLTRLTNGRPVSQDFETQHAADTFMYYAGWTDKLQGSTVPLTNGVLSITQYEPFGVTAGITPWNAPIALMAFKAAPSLAAGNCFILKPSEKTPFSSLFLGKLILEAGFPAGVFQILSGDGSTGELLANHLGIRKISFTGSGAAGRKVQIAAAKSNLKQVTLELGGKSPAVVFSDCNMEKAVRETLRSLLALSGQTCIAISRIYVDEPIYEAFLQLYREEMEKWSQSLGPPAAKSTAIGPLVDELQFQRVLGFIDRGQAQGGHLLSGGTRCGEEGYFVTPAIFTDVAPHQELAVEEVFGPVCVVGKFTTESEALQLCNDSKYGLNAAVFTSSIGRALRFADGLESGRVSVNTASAHTMALPFGGVKESGQGRECGREGIISWSELKTIFLDASE